MAFCLENCHWTDTHTIFAPIVLSSMSFCLFKQFFCVRLYYSGSSRHMFMHATYSSRFFVCVPTKYFWFATSGDQVSYELIIYRTKSSSTMAGDENNPRTTLEFDCWAMTTTVWWQKKSTSKEHSGNKTSSERENPTSNHPVNISMWSWITFS